MGLLRTALLKGSESRWLQRRVTRSGVARRAVRRFMPGEDVDAALAAAKELEQRGISSVLTRLGENVSDLAEAREVTDHYLDVLDEIARRTLPCHLSLKLTQFGLDIDRGAAEAEVRRLVDRASQLENFVWIDMEGSSYTDVTLDIFRSLRASHENVGLCAQAYLYRTAADLDALTPLRPAIRLVKGAYREPASLAFPKKRDVDDNFFALTMRLLDDSTPAGMQAPGIATHDRALIERVCATAQARGVAPDRYEFQMLFGIAREEQQRLVREGYRVRVLISYGNAWFPWYMRRLAERPANLLFVAKSMVAR